MASYTQTIEDITPGNVTGWQETDAGTAPNNSVAEIIALNAADATTNTVGVRDTAEAVTKTLELNEAEGGGNTASRFLINVDSSGNVDLFRDSTDVSYYLVGYWEGVTWTDQWVTHNVTSKQDDAWYELPNAAPPDGLSLVADRVHNIVLVNAKSNAQNSLGVRQAGGADPDRRFEVMEAENGGDPVQTASMYVLADGNGDIDVYTAAYDTAYFINQGYFDSAITFTEDFATYEWAGINNWTDVDLFTDEGVPKGRVVDFICANQVTGVEINAGVRKNGTADDRRFQLREAEGEGLSPYGTSVQTDVDGIIECFATGFDPNVYSTYRYTGYFNVGTAGTTTTTTTTTTTSTTTTTTSTTTTTTTSTTTTTTTSTTTTTTSTTTTTTTSTTTTTTTSTTTTTTTSTTTTTTTSTTTTTTSTTTTTTTSTTTTTTTSTTTTTTTSTTTTTTTSTTTTTTTSTTTTTTTSTTTTTTTSTTTTTTSTTTTTTTSTTTTTTTSTTTTTTTSTTTSTTSTTSTTTSTTTTATPPPYAPPPDDDGRFPIYFPEPEVEPKRTRLEERLIGIISIRQKFIDAVFSEIIVRCAFKHEMQFYTHIIKIIEEKGTIEGLVLDEEFSKQLCEEYDLIEQLLNIKSEEKQKS